MRVSDYVDIDTVGTTLKLCTLALLVWGGVLIILSSLTYFPPQFASGFLFGRQDYFYRWYGVAFYTHLFSAPAVLLLGAVQFIAWIRVGYPSIHRVAGRLYVVIALGGALPSGVAMAIKASGGLAAVTAFMAMGVLAIARTVLGTYAAYRQDFQTHRRWMMRSYLLMSSAVLLRVLATMTRYFQLESILTYSMLAWLSWVPSIAIYELIRLFYKQKGRGAVADILHEPKRPAKAI